MGKIAHDILHMANKQKKVVVTGGSGFIGAYFCRELMSRGDEVTILDLVEPGDESPHHTYVYGDIRDEQAVRKAFVGCDEVIHLAAAHHDFGIDEKTYYSVNEEGLKIITRVMDEFGMSSISFYSTVAVYGNAPPPLTEETTPQPETFYGKSKLAGEVVLKEWVELGGERQALVIRPTVTFGVNNFANMYSLLRQVNNGKFFFAKGSSNIKSLSYIENIVAATMYLLDTKKYDAFDVFNYIDKPDLTSIEIAESCYQALQKPLPKVRLPLWLLLLGAKPFDLIIALTGKNLPVSSARVRKLFVDQTKFEADKILATGYTPEVSLPEAIKRTANWYVERGQHESATWHQPPKEVVRS